MYMLFSILTPFYYDRCCLRCCGSPQLRSGGSDNRSIILRIHEGEGCAILGARTIRAHFRWGGACRFPVALEKECNMCDYCSDSPGKPMALPTVFRSSRALRLGAGSSAATLGKASRPRAARPRPQCRTARIPLRAWSVSWPGGGPARRLPSQRSSTSRG